mmetsp:Transcript_149656/g.480479  ORF Transcript_149656/g.480479 Transcript_149656/m.480479 type:complete len:366 (+) Transcript_149656:230-1327(+)
MEVSQATEAAQEAPLGLHQAPGLSLFFLPPLQGFLLSVSTLLCKLHCHLHTHKLTFQALVWAFQVISLGLIPVRQRIRKPPSLLDLGSELETQSVKAASSGLVISLQLLHLRDISLVVIDLGIHFVNLVLQVVDMIILYAGPRAEGGGAVDVPLKDRIMQQSLQLDPQTPQPLQLHVRGGFPSERCLLLGLGVRLPGGEVLKKQLLTLHLVECCMGHRLDLLRLLARVVDTGEQHLSLMDHLLHLGTSELQPALLICHGVPGPAQPSCDRATCQRGIGRRAVHLRSPPAARAGLDVAALAPPWPCRDLPPRPPKLLQALGPGARQLVREVVVGELAGATAHGRATCQRSCHWVRAGARRGTEEAA